MFNDDEKSEDILNDEDENDPMYVRRRKKVILTGVFVENEADMSLDKLISMKSRR